MNWQRLGWGAHYELNYLISEGKALKVREFVQAYLEFEEYSVGRPNYSYPVHNLYLDSDDLKLYRDAINDIEHRCQLRVRYYSADPDSPVWLETKRRTADMVLRKRGKVRREAVGLTLDGQLPGPDQLASPQPKHLGALQTFVELVAKVQARPKLHVAFTREGYVTDDGSVRVTLDRAVTCEAASSASLKTSLDNPRAVFHPGVLLELNFKERFPDWFGELVRHFNLTECEADKYVTGISACGQYVRAQGDSQLRAKNIPSRIPRPPQMFSEGDRV